jgi:hypothetical protein
MSLNDNKLPDFKQSVAKYPGKTRRLYRKPKLEELGDLRTLTLGGSPGAGDSGAPMLQKVKTGMPVGFPPLDGYIPPSNLSKP